MTSVNMVRVPLTRSQIMSRIRSENTIPEMVVRRKLHSSGLRYRLHVRTLPGTPDIVLPSRHAIVEVRGCFWHQHPACRAARLPQSRQDYWTPKLARNVERDALNAAFLSDLGWQVIVIWECETRDPARLDDLAAQLQALLPKRLTTADQAGNTPPDPPPPSSGHAAPRPVWT
jgi:DNA mismatch endonuclease (patch repair protein)